MHIAGRSQFQSIKINSLELLDFTFEQKECLNGIHEVITGIFPVRYKQQQRARSPERMPFKKCIIMSSYACSQSDHWNNPSQTVTSFLTSEK